MNARRALLKVSGGTAPRTESHKARNIVIVAIIGLGALTAAIVVANIYYGCLGCYGFVAVAQVRVASISCTGSSNTTCSAELSNTGAAGTQVVSAYIVVSGRSVSGSCQHATVPPAGDYESNTNVRCTFPIAPGVPGAMFVGSIMTSNGGQVQFTGVFSATSGGYTSTTYVTSWNGPPTTMTTTVTMTTTT
jgi:hypothetical protein